MTTSPSLPTIARRTVGVVVLASLSVAHPNLAFAFEPPPVAEAPATEEPTTEEPAATPSPTAGASVSESVVGEADPSEGLEDDVSALIAKGAAAYDAGQLEEAIRLFGEAYAVDPRPNLVFNIGRVHEELGDLAEAVDFYSRFVVLPGIDLEDRKLALERIRVLREVLAETNEAAEEPEPPAPPPPVVEAPVAPPEPPPVVEPAPVDRGRNLRIAGYTLLGVGVGAGAAALGVGLTGLDRRATAERQCEPLCGDPEVASIRNHFLAADILAGVSGAIAATSLVLIGVGVARDDRREKKVSAVLSPSQVGLRLRW